MSFIEELKRKAKSKNATIILPEANNDKILKACEKVLEEEICNIVLIGNKEEILNKGYRIERATIIDPNSYELTNSFIDNLINIRKDKGMDYETARNLILSDNMYYACMLVKMGYADGIVSGIAHSSADTFRPALKIIKTRSDCNFVSSFFIMDIPNCNYEENGVLLFSDCGLIQDPNSEELAEVAKESAKSFENIVNKEPVVAMLSHSTLGSAKHEKVNKVKEAVNIAKERYSEYKIDGEFQLDTAIIPEIANIKAPGNDIAGSANVLIFPDIDSGNIGYKLVEHFAKAKAYGPLSQGMNKPVNDLSRGSSIEDIIGVITITALQK